MYELKKIGKVFTGKFVGTGPSSYNKKNLPGRGLTGVEKHWCKRSNRQRLTAAEWKVQVTGAAGMRNFRLPPRCK